MRKLYSGINIQFPISRLILSNEKTVETRTYRIPKQYISQDMLMIETPGKSGTFKSRIVAMIRFKDCFEYKSEQQFYSDFSRHKVPRDSPWAYDKTKGKWGWTIEYVKPLKTTAQVGKRVGIKFTKNILF